MSDGLVIPPPSGTSTAPAPGKCLLSFPGPAGPVTVNPAMVGAIFTTPDLVGGSVMVVGGVVVEIKVPVQVAMNAWAQSLGFTLAMVNPAAPKVLK